MTAFILSAAAMGLGWYLGIRWERGRREMEQAAYELRQAERGDRLGSYQLSTVRVKR